MLNYLGTRQHNWQRNYATSQKVTSSIPINILELFNQHKSSNYNHAVDSASSRNEYRDFPGGKLWPTRKAGKIIDISELIA
jgi:hypothetical protein